MASSCRCDRFVIDERAKEGCGAVIIVEIPIENADHLTGLIPSTNKVTVL